ncbi:unnamed protein product [Sphagnum tenellum]
MMKIPDILLECICGIIQTLGLESCFHSLVLSSFLTKVFFQWEMVTYNRLEVNLSFFLKRHNYKGSISFAVGFCLVLWGWAVVGMLVQEYGS